MNNAQKITRLFVILLLFFFVFSCKKNSNDVVVPEHYVSKFPTEEISGTIVIPSGSMIKPQNLTVVSTVNEASIGDNGNFKVEAFKNMYSFVYALDLQGNTIGATYTNVQNNFRIDETSTAVALIMMFPVDWGDYGLTVEQLQIKILGHTKFATLKNYVRNIMINDPTDLMDYESHPSVLNTASDMVLDLIKQNGGAINKNKLEKSAFDNVMIKDIPKNPKITIINPKATPYGICAYKATSDPHDINSYTNLRTPFYVYGKTIKWWVIPEDGTVDYELGDGEYILMLSRIEPDFLSLLVTVPPYALSSFQSVFDYYYALYNGDYLKVLNVNSKLKGTVGGLIYLAARTLGVVAALDPSQTTDLLKIILEDGATYELFTKLTLADTQLLSSATGNYSINEILKWFPKVLSKSENIKLITDLFLKSGVKISAKFIETALKNFTIILKVAGGIKEVYLLGSFFYDMAYAESSMVFSVKQNNGDAIISASLAPIIPTITGPTTGTEGNNYNFNLKSMDPEGDLVRYILYYGDGKKEESGYLNSGQSYTFTHNFNAGNYELYAFALDDKGAMSSQSNILRIRINPAGGFVENFETYSTGDFLTTSTWNVSYELPSQIRISSVGYHSGQSVKFIDFDPSIGEDSSKYASMQTILSSTPSSVEFAIKVDDINDAFGIRAWGQQTNSNEDWNTISYYILFDHGYLKWVKRAENIEDPSDFVSIKEITVDTWYKIKLNLNWSNSTYDILIDNVLHKQGATFVAYNRVGERIQSTPYFQAVAFTNAQCRGAYLDEIFVKGTTLGKVTRHSQMEIEMKSIFQISESK